MTEENPDKKFYHDLWELIQCCIDKLKGYENYDHDTVIRLVQANFIHLQKQIENFAMQKGWMKSQALLEEVEKRCRNGRCVDCD